MIEESAGDDPWTSEQLVLCRDDRVGLRAVIAIDDTTLGSGLGGVRCVSYPSYGAAITAHAVRDGLHNGALWAWLQSSEVGYRVYERLGFTTLERWPCWVSRV